MGGYAGQAEALTRFVFHHIPKTGGIAVTAAAERAGLRWERAWTGQETLKSFAAANADRSWWSSHFLFRDYEPGPDEVYFTWIRHPVDMFYSGYFFWREHELRGEEFPIREMTGFMRSVGQYEDARAYTDGVLARSHEHAFPRGLFNLDWGQFHFIGQTDRMDESLTAFNARFGTNLAPVKANVSTRPQTQYRRDELETLLRPEIEAYRLAKTLPSGIE